MHSYFKLRQSRSMKTLSIQRPRPSIEMRTPSRLQNAGKARRGELAALVRIEDVRTAEPCQGFFQRLNAELNIHGVRHPPGQNLPRRPVHHRNQVEEAAPHR